MNYKYSAYDNLNRLVSAPDSDITYDSKGNITVHDAAGVYGYDPARPYALSQITLTASGFPTSEQTVSYNSMNRPDTISERGTVACLEYFEDGERSQMTLAGRGLNCTYRYFGNQFTVIDNNLTGSQKETQMLFIGGDAYNAPAAFVREKAFNSNKWIKSMYFIVRDNLGSITHVVDSTGAVVQELSYDAWGRLRDPETQQVYAPGNQPDLLLGRGYCGHEHMPAFNLLNMNARLYDPWTARFLSPDPYVQLPDFTQSLNRYSYCLNNPFKFVDPSGKDSWYTNDEDQINAFLQFYIQHHGHFAGNTLDDWLNEHGWEYEGEGLNRIDLDRMRLYTTYNSFSGSNFYKADETHINMNEITVNSYYYDLSHPNSPSYSFKGFNDQSSTLESIRNGIDFTSNITSPVGTGLTTQQALWNSVGVESTFLKGAGKVFVVPGTISSAVKCYENFQNGKIAKGCINAVDVVVGIATICCELNPYVLGATVAWYLLGDVIIYNLLE